MKVLGITVEELKGKHGFREEEAIFFNDHREKFEEIVQEVDSMKKSAFSIGKQLAVLEKIHKKTDVNLYHMIEELTGFKRTTAQTYLSIYRKFGELPKYRKYSYSQLQEMLSIENEVLKKITPDLSVKKIRSIKKEISRKEDKEINEECPTSGASEENIEVIDIESKEIEDDEITISKDVLESEGISEVVAERVETVVEMGLTVKQNCKLKRLLTASNDVLKDLDQLTQNEMNLRVNEYVRQVKLVIGLFDIV